MVRSIEELRRTPDEALIAEHDRIAVHTSVGTDYYSEELYRRAIIRETESNRRLARAALWLTVANTLLAGVAVIIALIK